MKKRSVILIVVIFLLALISLFFLQKIWLDTLIADKRIQFRREMNEVFNDVVHKFHRLELVRNFEQGDKEFRDIFARVDSLELLIQKSTLNLISDKNMQVKEHLFRELILPYDSLNYEMHKMLLRTFHENTDKIEDEYYGKHGHLLNIIIREELLKHDIDVEFDYGIYDPNKNIFLYQKGDDPEILLNSRLQYVINPDDIFFTPKYLLVTVAGEREYILHYLRLIMLICIFISIFTIAMFTYAAVIIIRNLEDGIRREEFSRDMAHDFKTPLSTIRLSLDMLSDDELEVSKSSLKRYTELISKETVRLQMMVEKILFALKTNHSRIIFDKKEMNIEDAILETLNTLQLQIQEQHAIINTYFDANAPVISGDRFYIVNVLINVLENALKYSKGENSIINITTRNEQNGLLLTIEDNGIGISKTDQKQIFNNHYRSSSPSVQKTQGYGVGLHYAKMIIEKHGGNIMVESKLNKWTKFFIYLPK